MTVWACCFERISSAHLPAERERLFSRSTSWTYDIMVTTVCGSAARWATTSPARSSTRFVLKLCIAVSCPMPSRSSDNWRIPSKSGRRVRYMSALPLEHPGKTVPP
eukprot:970589-Amphidinium_carterae.2